MGPSPKDLQFATPCSRCDVMNVLKAGDVREGVKKKVSKKNARASEKLKYLSVKMTRFGN